MTHRYVLQRIKDLEYLYLFMGVVVFVVYHCQLKVGKHFETGQHAAGGRARVME